MPKGGRCFSYFTRRYLPLNRVSFAVKFMQRGVLSNKNYMLGYYYDWYENFAMEYHVDRKIMRQCFYSVLSCFSVCKVVNFYATGCRLWRGFPHTPVTYPVKYSLGACSQQKSLDSSTNVKARMLHPFNHTKAFTLWCEII